MSSGIWGTRKTETQGSGWGGYSWWGVELSPQGSVLLVVVGYLGLVSIFFFKLLHVGIAHIVDYFCTCLDFASETEAKPLSTSGLAEYIPNAIPTCPGSVRRHSWNLGGGTRMGSALMGFKAIQCFPLVLCRPPLCLYREKACNRGSVWWTPAIRNPTENGDSNWESGRVWTWLEGVFQGFLSLCHP